MNLFVFTLVQFLIFLLVNFLCLAFLETLAQLLFNVFVMFLWLSKLEYTWQQLLRVASYTLVHIYQYMKSPCTSKYGLRRYLAKYWLRRYFRQILAQEVFGKVLVPKYGLTDFLRKFNRTRPGSNGTQTFSSKIKQKRHVFNIFSHVSNQHRNMIHRKTHDFNHITHSSLLIRFPDGIASSSSPTRCSMGGCGGKMKWSQTNGVFFL